MACTDNLTGLGFQSDAVVANEFAVIAFKVHGQTLDLCGAAFFPKGIELVKRFSEHVATDQVQRIALGLQVGNFDIDLAVEGGGQVSRAVSAGAQIKAYIASTTADARRFF